MTTKSFEALAELLDEYESWSHGLVARHQTKAEAREAVIAFVEKYGRERRALGRREGRKEARTASVKLVEQIANRNQNGVGRVDRENTP